MERIAFYSGSFDPFTKGHLAVLAQASMTFDRVVVGIGCNASKKAYLTDEEKVTIIDQSIKDLASMYKHRELIGQEISPAEAYLAQHPEKVSVITYKGLTIDAAVEWGASVMIRGERLIGDHDEEMRLAQVNQELCAVRGYNLQTVIIPVPDVKLTYVSSTTVRNLFSLGEYVVAMNYVTPSVHNLLVEKSLRQEYGLLTEGCNYDAKDLFESYRARKYHNLSHISYMLNFMNIFIRATDIRLDKRAMKLAIFWHDFYQGENAEELSSARAKVAAKFSYISHEDVQKLIMATKHNAIDGQKLDEMLALIHDLDLAILGDSKNYGLYAYRVREEYTESVDYEVYVKNRIKLLNSFLEKERIYLTQYFFERFESKARENIRKERDFWGSKNL